MQGIILFDDLIAEPDAHIGQSVTVAGTFLTVQRNRRKISYLASSEPTDTNSDDETRIFIDHTADDLAGMIVSLPRLLLIYQGTLTNPPYLHHFPLTLTATLVRERDDNDEERMLALQDITYVQIDVPYSGKVAEITPHAHYIYTAQISYQSTMNTEDGTEIADGVRAMVNAQKYIVITEPPTDDTAAEALDADRSYYARRITGKKIRLRGRLHTVPSTDAMQSHFVVHTASIRPSLVALGSGKEDSGIWIRPSDIYTILRTHITRPLDSQGDIDQAIEVEGTIDYIQEATLPFTLENAPKLAFTHIDSITLQDTRYLR